MKALILLLLFNQDLPKENFNLINNAEKTFHVGEIRVGWQYDEEKRIFYRYKKQDKQQICLPGFR